MWSRPGDAKAKARANTALQMRPVGLRDWGDLKDKMFKLPASISSISNSMPPIGDMDIAANQEARMMGSGEAPHRPFEERAQAGEQMLSSLRKSSQQDSRVPEHEQMDRPSQLPNRDYILKLADPEYQAVSSENAKRIRKYPPTFQCTLCSKRFTRAYNLRSHLRTHTDERPFVCTVCGKSFTREHDRKRHEALHKEEKKFVCRGELKQGGQWGCNRRFARADALGRHVRSETGRTCIKPLLDEEAIERPISVLSKDYTLPAALLAQYPALATFSWSGLPQGDVGLDGDQWGRSGFNISGSDYYDEGDDGGTRSLGGAESMLEGLENIESGVGKAPDFSTLDLLEKRFGTSDEAFSSAMSLSQFSQSSELSALSRRNRAWRRNRWGTAKSSLGISSTISKDNTPGDCVRNASLLADFGRKHQRSCGDFPNRLSEDVEIQDSFGARAVSPRFSSAGSLSSATDLSWVRRVSPASPVPNPFFAKIKDLTAVEEQYFNRSDDEEENGRQTPTGLSRPGPPFIGKIIASFQKASSQDHSSP